MVITWQSHANQMYTRLASEVEGACEGAQLPRQAQQVHRLLRLGREVELLDHVREERVPARLGAQHTLPKGAYNHIAIT